jgi:SNF2 family DNA or RNA helicase
LFILHSSWDGFSFNIWVEQSAQSFSNEPRQDQTTFMNGEEIKSHPFILEADDILFFLQKHSIDFSLQDLAIHKSNLKLLLPTDTSGSYPVSSWNLDELSVTFPLELKKWFIPSISLPPDRIIPLLEKVMINDPVITLSPSLHYWFNVTLFALEILRRKAFIPFFLIRARKESVTEFFSSWEPLLSEGLLRKYYRFLELIPLYCQKSLPRKVNREALLSSFLQTVLDNFIRQHLSLFYPAINDDLSLLETFEATTESWFASLFKKTNPLLDSSNNAFPLFSGIMSSWKKELLPKKRTFKTAFILSPPSPQAESFHDWTLHFQLVAEDDPTIILPANKIWGRSSEFMSSITKQYESPQNRLLRDLSYASTFCPFLEDFLMEQFPKEITLSNTEAVAFMQEYTPLLQDHGFNVLLPSWWDASPSQIALHLSLQSSLNDNTFSSGYFSLHSLLDFNWLLSIDDATLTEAEFEYLAELKVPFAHLRGKWIRLSREEIEKAISFVESFDSLAMKDALPLAMDGFQAAVLPESIEVTVDESITKFTERLVNKSQIQDLSAPVGFKGTLRPYQRKGLAWLDYLQKLHFGACLADDMGLGKTIQIIALILRNKLDSRIENDSPLSLVICPTSILGNWKQEINRFAPALKVYTHHGPDRLTEEHFSQRVRDYDVVITSYGLIYRDFELLKQIQWDLLTIDEAQKIKNPNAKQTRLVKKIPAKFKVALTGTPIENRLTELWSIFDFLNPGYLGNLSYFKKNYVEPIESNNSAFHIEQLRMIIQPFILRRLKTDPQVSKDLPEKIEMKVYCSLRKQQAILYESVVKNLFEQLRLVEGIQRRGIILSALTKLKQICNHPKQFLQESTDFHAEDSGKLIRLTELLEEILTTEDKVLIFTQYTQLGELLQKYLEEEFEQEVLFLHGGVPSNKRDELVAAFQSVDVDSPAIFILSLKAGGVGLNLTAANHVFHYDRWWNPAVENQATDRAFRIGQRKNVLVHKFITEGTLEERIDKLIEEKKQLSGQIITKGDAWLTELSTDKLREIIGYKSVIKFGGQNK